MTMFEGEKLAFSSVYVIFLIVFFFEDPRISSKKRDKNDKKMTKTEEHAMF